MKGKNINYNYHDGNHESGYITKIYIIFILGGTTIYG